MSGHKKRDLTHQFPQGFVLAVRVVMENECFPNDLARMDEIEEFKQFLGPIAKDYNDAPGGER